MKLSRGLRLLSLASLLLAVQAPSAPATPAPDTSTSVPASSAVETLPCAQVPWHNDRCPLWTSVYDNPTPGSEIVGLDRAVASELSPDASRLFVIGMSTDDVTGRDIVTLAFDTASGAQVWATRHDSPAQGAEVPSDIAVSPDGSLVFVTGVEDDGLEISGTPSTDGRVVTLAYDGATGNLRWRATYDGPGGTSDFGHSVAMAPDGTEVYVSASSAGADASPERVTLAYKASGGEPVWQAIRPSPNGESTYGERSELVVSPDGSRVYVAGSEFPAEGSGARDHVVVAYGTGRDEEPAGQELWATRHDAGGPDEVRGTAISPDGSTVFVAGRSEPRWSVLAVSSSGEVRWTSTLAGTLEAWPNDLAVSPTGERVYVTGVGLRSLADPRDSYAATTVAYDASTGEVGWTSEYDPEGISSDEGTALGVSADGQTVFVGGHSSSPGAETGAQVTLAYDVDGTQLWVARVDDPPVSPVASARTLAVGADRVYTAGSLGRPVAVSGAPEGTDSADLVVAAHSAKVRRPNLGYTCGIEPRDPADGSPLGGYGTPQARVDAMLVRASDNGAFTVSCHTQSGDPFGFTVRYHFEFRPEPGTWEPLAPSFACAANTVPILGGGTQAAAIVVPGTPSCRDAEIVFPENHPSLGLPHRLCVAVLDLSECSAPWTHEKIG